MLGRSYDQWASGDSSSSVMKTRPGFWPALYSKRITPSRSITNVAGRLAPPSTWKATPYVTLTIAARSARIT